MNCSLSVRGDVYWSMVTITDPCPQGLSTRHTNLISSAAPGADRHDNRTILEGISGDRPDQDLSSLGRAYCRILYQPLPLSLSLSWDQELPQSK